MKKDVILIFSLLLLTAPTLWTQPGILDNSFGTGGYVITDIQGNFDEGTSIALQADQKILVAGWNDNGSDTDFAITRYLPDGSLDNTFGTAGIVTTDFMGDADLAHSIFIQTDGRIVVAGSTFNGGNWDYAVARYNVDGNLDNTFSGDGKQTIGIITNENDYAYTTYVQNDGKILIGGDCGNGLSNNDCGIVRFNIDGSLDNSFGTSGIVITDVGVDINRCLDIEIQVDGKIVVSGSSRNAIYNYDMTLIRYNIDGTLDSSFSSDGKVMLDFAPGKEDHAMNLEIQPDGKILVGGTSLDLYTSDFGLARFNSDGSLDNSFGTSGKVTTSISSTYDLGKSMILQNDGKIILSGYTYNGSNYDFAMVCYNSIGVLDSTFGTNGIVQTDFGGNTDFMLSSVMQNDGKILLAGWTSTPTDINFIVARYTGNPMGINSNDLESNTIIYPNPTSGIINISTSNQFDKLSIQVLNSNGQIIIEQKNISSNNLFIDFSDKPNGIYFLSIQSGTLTGTKKIIKH